MEDLDAVATRGAHHADDFHKEGESGIRGFRQADEHQSRQRLETAGKGAKPKRAPRLREADVSRSSWEEMYARGALPDSG